MPFYESVFIARQDIAVNQVEALTNTFAELIKTNGGSVTKTEQWGLRNLAYRINKNKKGHYVMFNLEAPISAIAEMERNMRLNEDVLRFMTIRVEELETGPSAPMRKEERTERPFGERGDRPDRGGDRSASDRPRRSFAPRDSETSNQGEAS